MDAVRIKGVLTSGLCLFTALGLAYLAINDYGQISDGVLLALSAQNKNTELATHQVKKTAEQSNQVSLLFGSAKKNPEKPIQQKIPETRLNLVLKGTFTHEDSTKASALIAVANKTAEHYFVGDEIPGGAELIIVGKGEITLRRNGQDELLKLPFFQAKKNTSKNFASRPSIAHHARSEPEQNTDHKNTYNQNTEAQSSGGHKKSLQDRLARLRNNLPDTNH